MKLGKVDNNPKSNLGKKLAVGAISTGVIAGSIVYLAKSGKIDTFTKKINNYSKGQPCVSSVVDRAKILKDKTVEFLSNAVDKVCDFSEKKLNPVKFNPDLASAELKAVETFNNFVK